MKDHKDEQWYQYLYYTENDAVNIERVDTVEGITGHETLDYVLRTLDILEENEKRGYAELTEREFDIIRTVLSWSEVAKGGSVKDREGWRIKGYPLDIHNIASAEIYYEEAAGDDPDRELIRTLIRTHGMIGQCLRGEVPVSHNAPLREITIERSRLLSMLSLLNECIIRGVSYALWERVGGAASAMIKSVLEGWSVVAVMLSLAVVSNVTLMSASFSVRSSA